MKIKQFYNTNIILWEGRDVDFDQICEQGSILYYLLYYFQVFGLMKTTTVSIIFSPFICLYFVYIFTVIAIIVGGINRRSHDKVRSYRPLPTMV